MQSFDFSLSWANLLKRAIELFQILGRNRHVKLPEITGAKAQLPPRELKIGDQSPLFKNAEISIEVGREFQIAVALFEIGPNVIVVHRDCFAHEQVSDVGEIFSPMEASNNRDSGGIHSYQSGAEHKKCHPPHPKIGHASEPFGFVCVILNWSASIEYDQQERQHPLVGDSI